MRTVQVHVPRGTVEATAQQMDIREVDFEAMAASWVRGEPLIEETIRTPGSLPPESRQRDRPYVREG